MKAKALAVAVAVSVMTLFAGFAPDAFAVTQVAEKQMIYQVPDKIEPALLSYTHFGVEYSVSVWMDFNPSITSTPSTLKYTAWTSNNLTNTGGSIPAVAGYASLFDPVLVKHPSLTRIYLVAGGRTDVTDQTDSALIVWYSDNGGWNWSSGYVFTTDRWTRDGNDAFFRTLDKPTVGMSPTGTLWVTFTSRPGTGSDLQVMSGVNSGSSWTWSGRTTLDTTNGAVAPLVFVDSDNDVYVMSTISSGIGVWRDDAQDQAGFVRLDNVPNSGAIRYFTVQSNLEVAPGVTVRAVTVPAGRIDRTRRRIVLVWHEINPAGGTQLRLAVYRLDFGTWNTPLFAAGTGVHHVNVGMDYDVNGNVLVTWYRFGGNTSVYWNIGKFVTFDANSNPSWVSDDAVTNRLGDVANLPAVDGIRYMGEYHDVSYTNGQFKTVHLIAVAPWSDPWTFTVQQ
jgi:hypothetical protein